MTPLRLLLVEDSEKDATLLVEYLRQGGYEPDFLRVDSAKALAEALDRRDWDLIIADYTMPGFSGSAALTIVRDRGLGIVTDTFEESSIVSALASLTTEQVDAFKQASDVAAEPLSSENQVEVWARAVGAIAGSRGTAGPVRA